MVYRVVEQHEGSIHVLSEPGKGATFRIYLPVIESLRHSSTLDEHQPPVRGGTETVLIAEVEALVRDLAVRILTGAGYRVLTAANGEEAVKVFRAHAGEISLTLLDMVMPKMNGRMAYQAMKSLKPDVKVIFCSGYDAEINGGEFLVEEGLELVQKPFDPDLLLHSVRRVLNEGESCHLIQTAD
jgi:CheY-like chemotaxis protein